jgi:hypothetical protein
VDVANILREAHKAVLVAELPKELQVAAFEKAIDLLSGRTAVAAGTAAVDQSDSRGLRLADGTDAKDPIGLISRRLGIDRETAERVYHVDGDDLRLVLSSTKLSGAKKTATEEIALLVAAGRQAARLDQETTDAERVREVAEHYRRYDSPNFARTIKDMHAVFIVRENGRKKMVKMTQPGWEAAQALVSRVVGAE